MKKLHILGAVGCLAATIVGAGILPTTQAGRAVSDSEAAKITGAGCPSYNNYNCGDASADGCPSVPTNYGDGGTYGGATYISCGTVAGTCNNNFQTVTTDCYHGGGH